jgi:hypothetical protein
MTSPKRLTPSNITTNINSDQLNRSKNYGFASGYASTSPQQIPDRVVSNGMD